MTAPVSTPSSALDSKRHGTLAIMLTVFGYACFNIGDAAVKLLAAKFAAPQIMVVNGLMVAGCMLAYGAIRQGREAFRIRNPKWVALRAVFAVGTGLANVVALPHVSLTTFYTLVFTSPFWVAILSALFLGEKLETRRLAVILSGFAVIAWILRPGSDIFNVWSFMVLASAFIYSCSIVTMRYLGTRESRVMIISSGSLLGVAVMLPFALGNWVGINWTDVMQFAALGVTGAIGVACIAYAFQTAPSAAVIAPFHYTQMIWGAALGYLLFNEVPQAQTMIGAALLIGGGLLLIWLESRALRASPQDPSLPFRAGGWFSRLRAYSPSPKER